MPQHLKRCTKCREEKPATFEYFHAEKGGKDGLRSHCKKCINKKSNHWYQSHREEALAYGREYNLTHKQEVSAKNKAYHRTHKEERHAYWIEYAPLHRDDMRKYHKQYVQAHSEEKRTRNRNRYAASLNNGGVHTLQDIHKQYANQKGKCYYCSAKVGKKYHVDHVVPLSKGGTNDVSNLVIACISCNLKKSDRLPHEWPESGRLL